jgi:acyl carrier protein
MIISPEDVLTRVRQTFSNVFGVAPASVELTTEARHITGWDSLGHLSIALGLEKAFGVTFDVSDLTQMQNVGDIVRIITEKLTAKTTA